MQQTKETITEEAFLDAIYKNAKMGADSIINLLPKVEDDAMRSVMTAQLDGYERYAACAARALKKKGVEPREENIMTRFSAKMGMAFNTMLDSTGTHIAEMMLEGSNMGIVDLTRLLNHYSPTQDSEAVRLAREVVRFEEGNLEQLKRYL
ncbi:MAG: hypothetical protein MR343_06220 [Clostridia bacterium]|nr:hypothetical protein [Clostridia bacterium]MDD7701017.1 hypothetical protein [Eubacteriales bacterium]MDY2827502.1 hypothetical protein [Eubacteriales bacterium]